MLLFFVNVIKAAVLQFEEYQTEVMYVRLFIWDPCSFAILNDIFPSLQCSTLILENTNITKFLITFDITK